MLNSDWQELSGAGQKMLLYWAFIFGSDAEFPLDQSFGLKGTPAPYGFHGRRDLAKENSKLSLRWSVWSVSPGSGLSY